MIRVFCISMRGLQFFFKIEFSLNYLCIVVVFTNCVFERKGFFNVFIYTLLQRRANISYI